MIGSEQPADRRSTHSDTQFAELPLDPHVPPAWVLPCDAKDELAGVWIEGGPAYSRARVGPPPPHELSVPAKERLRGDKKRCPAFPRQYPCHSGKEHSVSSSERGSADLSLEDLQLVAKDRDLDVLACFRLRAPDEPKNASQE